jgi:F-type H+-transporting ATPase subunit a
MTFHRSLIAAALIAVPSITIAQREAAEPTGTRALTKVIAPSDQHPAPGLDTIPAAPEKKQAADMIMPHITDSKHLELPWVKNWEEWNYEVTLPTWNVHVGNRVVDMGPTKHVVFLGVAGLLTCLLVIGLARAHARHSEEIGRPRRFAAGFEALILYLRNEVFLKALGGRSGAGYVPFVLTLFFFISFCNVLGLMPWGSTPTGNIAVTGTLAIITLIVIEVSGMKALGAGYLGTIVYWPHDMKWYIKLPVSLILTPIEMMGKLTKPFALTMRLFANMVAGHVVLLAFVGMMLTFGWLGFPALIMATLMMFMELFVALLQAFIFAMLAAVFIGQIRTAHH